MFGNFLGVNLLFLTTYLNIMIDRTRPIATAVILNPNILRECIALMLAHLL